jgi:glucan phosphoethanolaminetransferase (alkaline phosphatase superfamily)
MIQRIQSLFLLLAAGMAFGLFALPFASTGSEIATSSIFSDATYDLNDHIGLLVLFGLAGVLALVSIFLFKNRQLQMTLSRFALIANLLGMILAVIIFWQDLQGMGDAVPNDQAGAYLPLGFILFAFLALRFIGKDDKLVRSMDRLR